VFGKENKDVNIDLTYKIYEENSEQEEIPEYKLKMANSTTSSSIDIKNIVNSVGNYFLDIKFTSTNTKTNQILKGTSKLKFTALNKVKIGHVKISLANAVEKADEKGTNCRIP